MDYSAAELLTWLAKESRLLGWDMITFVDGGSINLVMHQESIRRANTADKIPPISGYIPNGADKRFALVGCDLHLPRLLFDSDLASDMAHLQLTIAEASACSLLNSGGGWRVRQLDLMGPLQAAALSLDIDLASSGGTVDASQVIKLDLSKCENFSIPHYNGDSRLLSEFFRQKFSALTDDQRHIPIGKLENTPLPLYQPVSFALRTQARGRDAKDVAGAVVIMVCMEGETSGNFPGADYRYLIPKDGEYSACVLFETPRLLMAQMAQALGDCIDGARFEIDRDGDRVNTLCTAGWIQLPSQAYRDKFPVTVSGKLFNVAVWVDIPAIKLDAEGAGIYFLEALDGQVSEVSVSLAWLQEISVSMFGVDDGNPHFMKMLTEYGYNFGEFLTPVKCFYGLDARFSYHLQRGEDVAFYLVEHEAEVFRPFRPTFAPIYIPDKDSNSLTADLVRTISGPIAEQVATRLQRLFDGEALGELISPVAKLNALLKESMPTLLMAKDIANAVLRINFDNVIKVTSLKNPLDMVGFGQVTPSATGFTINPMETTLLAGATKTFLTEPAASNVDWSADAVSGIVDNVRISIDPKGVFTAPAASDMTKPFAQVLVTATDKANRAIQRNALITVVSQSLSASPLVVVAPPNSKVSFNAWVLGDPLALEWKYQGKPLGKGQAATVTSPADTGTSAFVVEEVQVQDPVSKHTCTCVLITEMGIKMPMLVNAIVDQKGQKAVLEARVNGYLQDPKAIDWKVRYGPPGVEEGVYTPGSDQKARFALITATYDSDGFGIFEGYIVLALPLAEHRDLTVN